MSLTNVECQSPVITTGLRISGVGEMVDDPLARDRIAVPGVVPVDPRIARASWSSSPTIAWLASTFQRASERSSPSRSQPSCSEAEHRHGRVQRGVAARELAVAARLVGAVLAPVEHAELGQVAPSCSRR